MRISIGMGLVVDASRDFSGSRTSAEPATTGSTLMGWTVCRCRCQHVMTHTCSGMVMHVFALMGIINWKISV